MLEMAASSGRRYTFKMIEKLKLWSALRGLPGYCVLTLSFAPRALMQVPRAVSPSP